LKKSTPYPCSSQVNSKYPHFFPIPGSTELSHTDQCKHTKYLSKTKRTLHYPSNPHSAHRTPHTARPTQHPLPLPLPTSTLINPYLPIPIPSLLQGPSNQPPKSGSLAFALPTPQSATRATEPMAPANVACVSHSAIEWGQRDGNGT
jgi:hypothetical protein